MRFLTPAQAGFGGHGRPIAQEAPAVLQPPNRRLSKLLSYFVRHAPYDQDADDPAPVDGDGYVPIAAILMRLRRRHWTRADICNEILVNRKRRFS